MKQNKTHHHGRVQFQLRKNEPFSSDEVPNFKNAVAIELNTLNEIA